MAENIAFQDQVRSFVSGLGLDLPEPCDGAYFFSVDDRCHLILCQHHDAFIMMALTSGLRKVDLSQEQALMLLQHNGNAFTQPHIIASITGQRVTHWTEIAVTGSVEAMQTAFDRLLDANERLERAQPRAAEEDSEEFHIPLPKFGSDMVIIGS
ncbi:CesT family type III secretion system chaperone [Pseudovibrio sp. Tun.PSC04-5.I4]|uniref:CesT family type III secretion system chaperone n=1 Tax=Pseudovibrio sp. Tun.PSC04-5.I4 TaxID=1798213 RepID=UPI00088301FE|nr:CesT family type III secretion system chaperone [Pseudovibrio sp. Tun.PSC04-5.I4]SDR22050.1 Tir chaperone protein (CesT) family protein [Pseudovibrio sp. Tun.PSC04-5.I4]